MPLYEYKCKQCQQVFTLFKRMKDCKKKGKCPNCSAMAGRIVSIPNLQTDTNFGYTGKVDKRVGGPPIEGRADWNRRMAEKGLVPLTTADVEAL